MLFQLFKKASLLLSNYYKKTPKFLRTWMTSPLISCKKQVRLSNLKQHMVGTILNQTLKLGLRSQQPNNSPILRLDQTLLPPKSNKFDI